jgi:integrase
VSKVKLTKRSVEAQSPREKDVILWDTEVKGFGCKITPAGTRSYFLYYRNHSGTQRRPQIGVHGNITCEQARSTAKDWSFLVVQGDDPSRKRQSKRGAPTVAELCDSFLTDHSVVHNKPGTHYNYERLIKRFIVPAWGSRKVHEIDRADVSEMHKSLKNTPYQANRVLGMISKMMNFAEMEGIRPDKSNPTLHVPRNPEAKRERYLTNMELRELNQVLLKAEENSTELSSTIAAIRLLIATGARLSEVLGMRWDWIDLHRKRIYLPESKTGKKIIHLNGLAIEILSGIERLPDNPYVIVGKNPGQHLVNLQKPWRRIRKQAGLKDFRIHDIRHNYASIAVGAGQDLHMVGKLLGHTQVQTTHRYAHLADEPINIANDKIGGILEEAMSGPVRESD